MPQLNYQNEYNYPSQELREIEEELFCPRKFPYERFSIEELDCEALKPKKIFWFSLILLLSIPLANSVFYNFLFLGKNLDTSFKLKSQKIQLEERIKDLESKLKELNSISGLRRIIKEEVGLIDPNEIVIKIED
jgi:hypothetical protein